MSAALEVFELSTAAEIEAFADQWTGLHAACAGDLFATPSWFLAWLSAFGVDKRPRVLKVTCAAQLVGVLPLVQSTVKRRPWLSMHHAHAEDLLFLKQSNRRGCLLQVRQLCVATNLQSGSIRGGWIAAIGMEAEVLSAIAQHLASRRDWDMLAFPAVRSELDSEFSAVVQRSGLTVESRPNLMTLYGLTPEPWDVYYRRRSRHFRKRFNAAERDLGKLGEVRCVTTTRPEECPAALARMFLLAERSWKERPRTGQNWHLPMTPAAVKFYTELCARVAPRAGGVFHEIYVAERLVAALFSMVDQHTVYLLQTYYDAGLESGSPGRLLMRELIAWTAANNMRWIDFNGNSAYVRMFASEPRFFGQVWVFRNNGYSRILHRTMMFAEGVRRALARWSTRTAEPPPSSGELE